jgi:hypothetical protein
MDRSLDILPERDIVQYMDVDRSVSVSNIPERKVRIRLVDDMICHTCGIHMEVGYRIVDRTRLDLVIANIGHS